MSVKISSYITEKLNNELIKYCSLTGKSKSAAIEKFIENGLNLESTKNDIDFITNEIDRAIEFKIKPLENRLARINSKNAKSNLTTLYLLIELLSSLDTFNQEELKDLVGYANKKAYMVLKDGYIETDILSLFKEKESK